MPEIRLYRRGFLTVKITAIAAACMMLLAIMFVPVLPERIVPWWNEGQCWWFNGTIQDKWIEEGDGMRATKDYIFLVNGTLNELNETTPVLYDANSTTRIEVLVHGGLWDYTYFKVGDNYEGYACDTMTLREAVINGSIEFLIWTGV